MTNLCSCCGTARKLASILRRRQVREDGRWIAPAPGAAHHPLCGECSEWIEDVIRSVREPSLKPTLFGAPAAGGRSLVFNDQCQLCRELLGASASVIDCVAAPGRRQGWPPLQVCPACERWVASLAEDGRSARGRATRSLDGAYGEWLHPNLRNVRVVACIADAAVAEMVQETCQSMHVDIAFEGPVEPSSVLLLEATPAGQASAFIERLQPHVLATVILAPLAAKADLWSALQAGATDWLTVPTTPQQLTAALVRARRIYTQPPTWDEGTCLPGIAPEYAGKPMLMISPEPGADRFEIAWSLRRFSRGYDELGIYRDAIVLIPRVAAGTVSGVAERLARVLGPGTCTIDVLSLPVMGPVQRFEAAG
jgi:CheY-like chemotaxis protein